MNRPKTSPLHPAPPDGIVHTGTILDAIVAHKRGEISARKQAHPLDLVQTQAAQASPPRPLAQALAAPGVTLIAEVKRASPSQAAGTGNGALCPDLDPAALAQTYAAHGAGAVSVLTDTRFFQGNLDDLVRARSAITRPVLRKDFILEPYQVYEARAHGADAVLLIVAILEDAACRALLALTHELGMAALVEVHDHAELTRALTMDAHIIGVNNRNLHTFQVDLATVLTLRPHVPEDVLLVAESGISTSTDVARLVEAGVDAMLVGTALVTAEDPGAHVRSLVQAGMGDEQ